MYHVVFFFFSPSEMNAVVFIRNECSCNRLSLFACACIFLCDDPDMQNCRCSLSCSVKFCCRFKCMPTKESLSVKFSYRFKCMPTKESLLSILFCKVFLSF